MCKSHELVNLGLASELFVSGKIPVATTGIQSNIELGEVNQKPAIRKTAGKGLSAEIICQLVNAIPEYRESLAGAGLCLPKNFSVRSNNGLEIVDEFVGGKDIDIMILMRDLSTSETWKEMVHALCRANSGNNSSKAMIDAKPANFVKSGETLYYVDLFPPMLRDQRGLITPWVPEVYKRNRQLMSFNFGDTRGQLTKLLAGSRLAYPTMYEFLKDWTLQAIEGNIPYSVSKYIHEQSEFDFPDMKLFYSDQDITKRMEELLQ